MRHRSVIAIGVLLLGIGVAIGYYLGTAVKVAKSFDWKELTPSQSGKDYVFTSEALFNSDIPSPEVKRLSGKSKFLKPATKSGNGDLSLRYIISVEIDKLDLQKVPQKYKVEQKERYKAGEFTRANQRGCLFCIV